MAMPARGATPAAVCLESGPRRTFASALDWPGWCRSGRGDDAALEALRAAAPRYAPVAAEAGVPFRAEGVVLEVVERLPGTVMTDFGVPGSVAARETEALTEEEAARMACLVAASWTVLDRVVAGAPPVLRKGPRGGGRDRDAVFAHVVGAEALYVRKLGASIPAPAPGDTAAVLALRRAIVSALAAATDGRPVTPKGWPPRYAARRIAWHVLDHAWEIEDRSNSFP
jgi:hypothetical protein